ncbi:MAG: hypothetical protein QM723_40570 [Myxococcaceae bacterium]
MTVHIDGPSRIAESSPPAKPARHYSYQELETLFLDELADLLSNRTAAAVETRARRFLDLEADSVIDHPAESTQC